MAQVVQDGFEIYYTEKLWEMIPAFYRDEDGQGANPGVLRGVIEIVGRQAALLRRSIDTSADNQSIDLCQEWAVGYLADLLGTRLVSAKNARGRRVDVAKTIYYRRRKGTLRVLEELIADITGFEGVVVEELNRLIRFPHGLDPHYGDRAGRFSGTYPGGLPDLRNTRAAGLAGGPFEEFHHTPDVRRPRGLDGRYGIPRIAFHLYRLNAYELRGLVPVEGSTNLRYFIDPSGRDVPLFQRRRRNEAYNWDIWRSAQEWELPAPIRCRLLNHAEFEISEVAIQLLRQALLITAAQATELRTRGGIRFTSAERMRATLALLPSGAVFTSTAVFSALQRFTLIEDCGKSVLLPSYVAPSSSLPKSLILEEPGGTVLLSDRIAGVNLSGWTIPGAPPALRAGVDPERGRILFQGPAPASVAVTCLYGFPGEIGAGGYDRASSLLPPTAPAITGGAAIPAAAIDQGTAAVPGVTQIDDSLRYAGIANLSNIVRCTIQAANFCRPYLRRGTNWVLSTGVNVESELILEGVWFGSGSAISIFLDGDYERVTLRHMTIDPGGTTGDGAAIPAVRLVVRGRVENLRIQRSITGPIVLDPGSAVERIDIEDSIIHSRVALVPALTAPLGEVHVDRSTVLGTVTANVLHASDSLFTDIVAVTNVQIGCFRFSSAAPGSIVPKPYESYFLSDSGSFFTTRIFGQSAYMQLSANAPTALRTGGEDGGEIGAWAGMNTPAKISGLRAKAEEYMSFGLIPVVVFET